MQSNQFRFGTILVMVSLPVLRHLKVSISGDMCKAFNVFNTSSFNMLIVLKSLHIPNIMLTFQMSS